MNHIFRTTIKDLISRNQFFQCFVCYDEFNSDQRYPMEVCRNHHYMCEECVKSRAFKSKAKNQYNCGLCSVKIKISEIKRNSFILSIKEFFQSLIEREESSRQRYREFMESQQKIVQILLEQNQNIIKESQKYKNEVDKLKEQIKAMKKHLKNEEKKIKDQQKGKVKPPQTTRKSLEAEAKKGIKNYVDYFEVSEDQQRQFETLVNQKDNNKPPIISTNSIFRSNMVSSSLNTNSNQEKMNGEFIPSEGFSKLYNKGTNSVFLQSKTESKIGRLIEEQKRMKEKLISKQHQNKMKLKQSMKELQVHKKYIEYSADENDKQKGQSIHGELRKQPQKKVHVNEQYHLQKPKTIQQNSKPMNTKPKNSWFPFL